MKKFGTFELDVRSRELRKGGIRIRLQDQPFEILAMMLDRPGEVVTRDELRKRLWPDGTFVDFEHSLNAAVKRLRAALGDDADNPRFVETLHRRGYRFIAPVASPENGDSVRPMTSVRLVVLPFENLSGDPTQDYFSDGLTEEMITQIMRLCPSRLGVIARTSAMLFKRSGKSACDIGKELEVDYLLEGSVRHEGSRVRITAQLIQARTEEHLWAETYDRRLEETLLLQSDVAARIARSLAMELVPDQEDAISRVSPRHAEAYQQYLKGRFHWNRTGDEGLLPALAYYERALHLDSGFATALGAMSRAQITLAEFSHEPGRIVYERARDMAQRSLELDPGIAEAYVVLAEVHKGLEWNWTAAEAAYRKALSLASSCDAGHRYYAIFLAAMLRHDEARAEVSRAAAVDPLCLAVNTCDAWLRYATGDFDQSIQQCLHTLEMDPSYTLARRLLGAAYVAAGLCDEGISELETACGAIAPNDRKRGGGSVSLAWLAHAKAAAGRREEAKQLIDQLNRVAGQRYVPAYHMAIAYAGIDDADAAFTMLSRACDERDPALIHIRVEPRFGTIRNNPRYAQLLSALGLPD